jgi:hypothetical protein
MKRIALLALLLCWVGAAAPDTTGQEKKLPEPTDLGKLAVDVLEAAIPKDVLPSDGNWTQLNTMEAIELFAKFSKDKSYPVTIRTVISDVRIGLIPASGEKEIVVSHSSPKFVSVVKDGKIQFRGRKLIFINASSPDLHFPFSEKAKWQAVQPGSVLLLSAKVRVVFNGQVVLTGIDTTKGPPQLLAIESKKASG